MARTDSLVHDSLDGVERMRNVELERERAEHEAFGDEHVGKELAVLLRDARHAPPTRRHQRRAAAAGAPATSRCVGPSLRHT